MVKAPPVRRRLVGGALRRYRENLGYTLEDAARVLECDRSKVSRIETGQRGIRARDLRDLLGEYGIDGEQQAVLVAMADPRGGRGWAGMYADVLPGACQEYLLLESSASRVSAYEAQRIPALLQTPDYARALAEADPGLADAEARDRIVEATLARQEAIFGERKPDIHLIIGEAALHQEVGGPVVMEGQLGMLAGVSGDSGVITVQVLPFSSGAHAGAGVGSLTIVQFPHAPGLGAVYLDGASGGVCLESQADLAAYVRVFEQLKVFALSPAQSALMLGRRAAA
jgi:transcriptional regulator with XRE-family HTH domain